MQSCVRKYTFFLLMRRRPTRSKRTDTLLPYTTLCRSDHLLAEPAREGGAGDAAGLDVELRGRVALDHLDAEAAQVGDPRVDPRLVGGRVEQPIGGSVAALAGDERVALRQHRCDEREGHEADGAGRGAGALGCDEGLGEAVAEGAGRTRGGMGKRVGGGL